VGLLARLAAPLCASGVTWMKVMFYQPILPYNKCASRASIAAAFSRGACSAKTRYLAESHERISNHRVHNLYINVNNKLCIL
jgi:hypothetical protein